MNEKQNTPAIVLGEPLPSFLNFKHEIDAQSPPQWDPRIILLTDSPSDLTNVRALTPQVLKRNTNVSVGLHTILIAPDESKVRSIIAAHGTHKIAAFAIGPQFLKTGLEKHAPQLSNHPIQCLFNLSKEHAIPIMVYSDHTRFSNKEEVIINHWNVRGNIEAWCRGIDTAKRFIKKSLHKNEQNRHRQKV